MRRIKHLFNVLIAEDNREDCRMLVEGLKDIAQCTIAVNGEEALKIFQQWQSKGKFFDFILLDIDMPVLNGFDILKTIRAKEETLTAKNPAHIIMITTYKDSLMENYNLGWDDFITKPVDIKILVERMNSMIAVVKK